MKVNIANMHVYLRCHGNKVVVAGTFWQLAYWSVGIKHREPKL